MKVYFSKSKAKYFTLDIDVLCGDCGKSIENFCFLKKAWFMKKRNQKKPMKETYYCMACSNKIYNTFPADYEDLKIIVCVDKLPSDALPVLPSPPSVKPANNDLNVFDVAEDNTVPIENDYTKLSGRTPSIEGVQIGNPNIIKELDKKDHLKLSENQVDDWINKEFGLSIESKREHDKLLEEHKDGE